MIMQVTLQLNELIISVCLYNASPKQTIVWKQHRKWQSNEMDSISIAF